MLLSAHRRLISIACFTLMLVGVLVVYCPSGVLTGRSALTGADFQQLHERRIRFAREALLESKPSTLPGWYPRELMGTPFWSNVQNFPFIPTRLAVFFAFRPEYTYGAAIALAAMLSATFTWLLCRRLGMSAPAAAVSGWTFACCGFFGARVMAGHMPLLEAFPALPLLLWLVDRALRNGPATPESAVAAPLLSGWRLVQLGVASACVALAGHPQLPIYALLAASAYALVLERNRRGLLALLAMALGGGVAAFSLLPMMMLVGRSTRVLDLAASSNDLAFPYGRLAALFFPWRDGWPPQVPRDPAVRFDQYPTTAYFWDTVAYVGWLPWLALGWLSFVAFVPREQRRQSGRRERSWFAVFMIAASIIALALALPMWQPITSMLPGTILRSPARLMYVVSFGLSVAAGAGLDSVMELIAAQFAQARRMNLALTAGVVAIVAAVAAHAFDLGRFTRTFVTVVSLVAPAPPEQVAEVHRLLGDGRAGFDLPLVNPMNRAVDDMGFFDSVILARPYRFMLDTSGMKPRLNEQAVSASLMGARTLRAGAVRLVFTRRKRPDLTLIGATADSTNIYSVPGSAPRAELIPMSRVLRMPADRIHQWLRDPAVELSAILMLPAESAPAPPAGIPTNARFPSATSMKTSVTYRRPGPDQIDLSISAAEPGYLRIVESFDAGWTATLDGRPAQLEPADDTFLSMFVPAGQHEATLRFRTPGAGLAIAVSITSLALLAGLGVMGWRLAALPPGGTAAGGIEAGEIAVDGDATIHSRARI